MIEGPMISSSPLEAPARRMLVTGAAGFIGSHVTDELLARGHEVVALDDLSGGVRAHVDPRAHFVQGSILDVALIERLFREHRIDSVYHLAAYAAEGLSHYVKRFNYENNLIGSVNLINASINHDVRCFVFASSVAVYGGAEPPVDEDMPLVPDDPYGVAKAAVEQELHISRRLFGLRSLIFRPHNVYGPRQNIGDRYRNVVGIFMNQILAGKPLTLFGDGTQTRAFSYVTDVVPVIVEASFRPEAHDQIFNIGSDRFHTILELAEMVSDAMGVPLRAQHLPARPEVKHNYASHEKAKSLLGYEARVVLEEGLAKMAAWVKKEGPRATPSFPSLEIERRLPPSWQKPQET